jgi:ankyrin repeat protein
LIDKGAAVELRNRAGASALHEAVKAKRMDMITVLLAARADVNAPDGTSKTPIYYSIQGQDELVLSKLIASGADVEKDVSSNGNSALHEACALGFTRGVAVLLKNGAQVNKKHRYLKLNFES